MTAAALALAAPRALTRPAVSEPTALRWLLTGLAFTYLGLFLVVPLAAIFTEALRKGWGDSGPVPESRALQNLTKDLEEQVALRLQG